MNIYTIGHSTHSLTDFTSILNSHGIRQLVDIRSLPGSRKFPHFNKEVLPAELIPSGIRYIHLSTLGGRRNKSKTVDPSLYAGWRNASFGNYAAYMQTDEFDDGIRQLLQIAGDVPTAYMCSEAVYWRCHRGLVSDALTARGITVNHIMTERQLQQHKMTSFAVVDGQTVTYPKTVEANV